MSVFYIRLSAIDRLGIKGQAYRSVERLKASHVLFNGKPPARATG